MRLIVNADDFGYSRAVNFGIVDAYALGIVRSATLMANMPGFSHAAALAQAHPGLGVGVHLVLTCGRAVAGLHKTITDDAGYFLSQKALLEHEARLDPAEVEREWAAQIEAVCAAGLSPTHLDSHHHVHMRPRLNEVVSRLAEKYRLPVRPAPRGARGADKSARPRDPDLFCQDFYGEKTAPAHLLAILERLRDENGNGTAELMCHPAYTDESLLRGSSYALPRLRELETLTDETVRAYVETRGIRLASYRELG